MSYQDAVHYESYHSGTVTHVNSIGLHSDAPLPRASETSKQARPWERPPCVVNPIQLMTAPQRTTP